MGPDSGSREGSENDSNAFKFQKLNGQNSSLWAENMQAALQLGFLLLLVSGAELCPSKPPDVKPSNIPAAEWKAEKKEYLNWLLRSGHPGVNERSCRELAVAICVKGRHLKGDVGHLANYICYC